MKNNKEFQQDKRQFIENYNGIDIHYTKENGFEIAGYWATFYTLDDCKTVIDYRLSRDMRANENKCLVFA